MISDYYMGLMRLAIDCDEFMTKAISLQGSAKKAGGSAVSKSVLDEEFDRVAVKVCKFKKERDEAVALLREWAEFDGTPNQIKRLFLSTNQLLSEIEGAK